MASNPLNETQDVELGVAIELKLRNLNPDYPFPDFKKPIPIGFFSVNKEADFEPNADQLRYYKAPSKFPLDLNVGLDEALTTPFEISEESIDNLLKFIFNHYDKIFSITNRHQPEFITVHSVLTSIMCTPYEYQKDWCINVTRFNDILYISNYQLDKKSETDPEKIARAWEYKFEQYCLWKTPFQGDDVKTLANNFTRFSCVFQARLNGLNILFGAKMNGVLSEEDLNLDYFEPHVRNINFVELKLLDGVSSSQQDQTLCKWWCQSNITGINDVILGKHDGKGFVQSMERMTTGNLFKMQAEKCWSPSVCMNFLEHFLLYIKQQTAHVDCPHSVHQYYFKAKDGRIYHKVWNNVNEYTFLPEWYEDFIEQK